MQGVVHLSQDGNETWRGREEEREGCSKVKLGMRHEEVEKKKRRDAVKSSQEWDIKRYWPYEERMSKNTGQGHGKD